MEAPGAAGTDTGIGIAIAMLTLAAIGALLMVVGALELTAALGFAIIVFAGLIAVWALHAFPTRR